jgi:thiamine biosynthesis lipoprotein ApbE
MITLDNKFNKSAERAVNNKVIKYLEEAKSCISKASDYSSLTIINNLNKEVVMTLSNDLDNLILDINMNGNMNGDKV